MKPYLTKKQYEELVKLAIRKGLCNEQELFELIKGLCYQQAHDVICAYSFCQGNY